MIDAHQHFWSLATPGHEWPTPVEAAIHRDFGPADLTAEASGLALECTVLVQSQPSDVDTDWLLDLAARTPLVGAVVGWVDLAAPAAPARIAALAEAPKLRGLRPMLQSIDDTEWLLQDSLAPAFAAMLDHGLRLDALIQPRHLPMLARFADRWPDLPIVIDHAAKPFIARNLLDPWRTEIAALAARGLWCKLSGLRTEQTEGQPASALAPYVEHLLESFGERLMWGSDWPVLRLSGDSYRDWVKTAERLTGVSGAAQTRLFSGAAAEFYGLPQARQ
ncbi:MAG: amidohydrolase family protein [Sphingomonas bacterium]